VATVQIRSVVERRGELALMRAVGFRRARLVRMIFAENALLLLAGLASGVATACVALLPHWLGGSTGTWWVGLVGMLLAIAAIGLASGSLAARVAARSPLLPALRGD
jgi:ABC-type antimicrobial peptide transport system permease subunit